MSLVCNSSFLFKNVGIGVTATEIWTEDIRTFVAELPFLEPISILFALKTPVNVEVGFCERCSE